MCLWPLTVRNFQSTSKHSLKLKAIGNETTECALLYQPHVSHVSVTTSDKKDLCHTCQHFSIKILSLLLSTGWPNYL